MLNTHTIMSPEQIQSIIDKGGCLMDICNLVWKPVRLTDDKEKVFLHPFTDNMSQPYSIEWFTREATPEETMVCVGN